MPKHRPTTPIGVCQSAGPARKPSAPRQIRVYQTSYEAPPSTPVPLRPSGPRRTSPATRRQLGLPRRRIEGGRSRRSFVEMLQQSASNELGVRWRDCLGQFASRHPVDAHCNTALGYTVLAPRRTAVPTISNLVSEDDVVILSPALTRWRHPVETGLKQSVATHPKAQRLAADSCRIQQ